MRYIIILVSVLLVTLLVFQNYQAHQRNAPEFVEAGGDPIVVRQKAIDVNQFVKDTAATQRRAIDEQLQ